MTHSAKGKSVSHKATRESSASGLQTPDQIRLTIQRFVAEDDVDTANSVAEEGLAAFPESEGVLAISSLVACVREDWDRAVDLLTRLIDIQGDRASDFTRMLFERAKNCSGGTVSSIEQPSAGAASTGH
jgi:hypothetical protein